VRDFAAIRSDGQGVRFCAELPLGEFSAMTAAGDVPWKHRVLSAHRRRHTPSGLARCVAAHFPSAVVHHGLAIIFQNLSFAAARVDASHADEADS